MPLYIDILLTAATQYTHWQGRLQSTPYLVHTGSVTWKCDISCPDIINTPHREE